MADNKVYLQEGPGPRYGLKGPNVMGQKIMNDKPEGDDALDLTAEAEAFAVGISSTKLEPPFTLGILGKFSSF